MPEILLMRGLTLPEDRQIPLLDAHNRSTIDAVKGSIRNLRIENNELVGDLDFDEGETDAQRKVNKRHVNRMSAGYLVETHEAIGDGKTQTYEWEEQARAEDDDECDCENDEDCECEDEDRTGKTKGEDGTLEIKSRVVKRSLTVTGPAVVATRWSIHEGSLVPWPADDDAKIRTRYIDTLMPSTTVVEQKSDTDRRIMEQETKVAETPALDEKAIAERAVQEHKAFRTQVRQLAEKVGLGAQFEDICNEAKDLNHARELVIDKWSSKPKPEHVVVGQDPVNRVGAVARDILGSRALDLIKANMKDDLDTKQLERMTPKGDMSRFAKWGWSEIARLTLEAQGVRDLPYMTNDEILERAWVGERGYVGQRGDDSGGGLPLNDFGTLPALMADFANGVMQLAYPAAPTTFDQVGRKVDDASNLLDQNILRVSTLGAIDAWPSGTNPKEKVLTDQRSRIKMVPYADNISIGWHALANDRFDFVSTIPVACAIAAKRRFNIEFWACFTGAASGGGQVMDEDNQPLYYSGHKNTSGSAQSGGISVANVSAAKSAMRQQVGMDGLIIGLEPRYLVTPSAQETYALQMCRSNFAPMNGVFEAENPFKGTLLPIVEPLLDATSTTQWMLFPTNVYSAGAYCFYKGQATPKIKTWIRETNNSLMFQVAQTGAVGAVDYRGVLAYIGS